MLPEMRTPRLTRRSSIPARIPPRPPKNEKVVSVQKMTELSVDTPRSCTSHSPAALDMVTQAIERKIPARHSTPTGPLKRSEERRVGKDGSAGGRAAQV